MKRRNYFTIVILVILIVIVVASLIWIYYSSSFDNEDIDENVVYCLPEQRNVDACILIYNPVCGWFDPEKIQCIRYPCASVYGNSCQACTNPDVLYYTAGECPV